MKVGDLVRYRHVSWSSDPKHANTTGVILYVNEAGGTLKVLDPVGQVDWYVTSYCEVINEARRLG